MTYRVTYHGGMNWRFALLVCLPLATCLAGCQTVNPWTESVDFRTGYPPVTEARAINVGHVDPREVYERDFADTGRPLCRGRGRDGFITFRGVVFLRTADAALSGVWFCEPADIRARPLQLSFWPSRGSVFCCRSS